MVAGKRQIKYIDEMKEHLSAFTGLEKEGIEEFFQHSEIDTFLIEFEEFVKPKTNKELVWYYQACRSQFVHNATHSRWVMIDNWIKPHDYVLDYGAGIGQNCIRVMQLGAFPTYFEISIIQREFFKFFCKREGIDIPIIEPYVGERKEYRFDSVFCIKGEYDVVLLKQVLEHIVDPEELLIWIYTCIKPGGLLLEDSPWETHNFGDLKSLTQNDFEYLMNSYGFEFVEKGVWRKKKEYFMKDNIIYNIKKNI